MVSGDLAWRDFELVEFRFWPSGDAPERGLVLCRRPSGERFTIICLPEVAAAWAEYEAAQARDTVSRQVRRRNARDVQKQLDRATLLRRGGWLSDWEEDAWLATT